MSNLEVLIKQLKEIKDKEAKLKMAEQFEAMAKTLRDGAEPKKFTFKEALGRKAEKGSGADRFGSMLGAMRTTEAMGVLKAAGWSMMGDGKGNTKVYGMKGKPGLQLRISGNKFSVHQGEDVVDAPMDLSFLKTYVTGKK